MQTEKSVYGLHKGRSTQGIGNRTTVLCACLVDKTNCWEWEKDVKRRDELDAIREERAASRNKSRINEYPRSRVKWVEVKIMGRSMTRICSLRRV